MSAKEKLTPAEIRQQEFSTGWRGFAPTEVRAFLGEVADAFSSLNYEIISLRADLEHQQAELHGLRHREQLLKDTLINAQQVIETMKANAQKEGEILIHESELKAEKILQEAFSRQARILGDIEELKRLKLTLTAELRAILATHQRLLDDYESAVA